ncbi:Uncharacterised protein [Enterobacter hormaechei]|nr:Uncharacterised protein [Enterobacter hormaechei]CZW02950.1 Uncharacterised protein [Enterobacter hormaechei]SAA78759.1 Uncharacterised protein [Enterobacter hormaechei]VAG87829.1 Uncharacterised protein [Enterobacter hormaechei]VAK38982.1 Uncharacterised protein [Enterobacter hormaechei]
MGMLRVDIDKAAADIMILLKTGGTQRFHLPSFRHFLRIEHAQKTLRGDLVGIPDLFICQNIHITLAQCTQGVFELASLQLRFLVRNGRMPAGINQ